MRHQIIGYSLVGLAALVIGSGAAVAQSPAAQPGQPVPGAAVPGAAVPGAAVPGAPGGAKTVAVSPQEQLAQAEGFMSGMESVRSVIRRELSDARQQRDVVKTLCLNDKLNQVDVALRSANERKRGLELAANRGDTDLSSHEYTILSVLDQRVKQLDAEAKQCVGKEIGIVGESSTSLDVEPGLPGEDPSEYPTVPTIVEPPMCSTCYK